MFVAVFLEFLATMQCWLFFSQFGSREESFNVFCIMCVFYLVLQILLQTLRCRTLIPKL